MAGEFLDTNILVYAHDQTAGEKQRTAKHLLSRLLDQRKGLLSTQVLMEFAVTMTQKVRYPLDSGLVIDLIKDFSTWNIFQPGSEDIVEGLRIAKRFRIHFWDAMIIRAASALNATFLWTEDLNDGQSYDGVVARNPFKQALDG